MIVAARAKVNLTLRVGRRRADGTHDIESLMASITWSDHLEVTEADEDEFALRGEGPPDETNLAWRGFSAGRAAGGRPARLTLRKAIPIAAGLGGGSADAAAGLVHGARLTGRPLAEAAAAAAGLGADVPFCLEGGLALVGGAGESVRPQPTPEPFGVAVVVPTFHLSTAEVYTAWDEMDGPQGPPIPDRAVPPGLRSHRPFVNDLWPAARRLAPEIDDWRAELEGVWGRPVLMSGSGPALFSLFTDGDEAGAALSAVDSGRARHAASFAPRGWLEVQR